MQKFSFHSSETFWRAQKLSYHKLVCLGRIQNLGELILPIFVEDFEMFDEKIILFLFCCFYIIKKLKVSSDA